MGRTLLQTAHRLVPTEGGRWRASPSGFRPLPRVPGLFSFRARVILVTDGPTHLIQRLPVRGKVPTFPHPEPPPLFVALGMAPSPGELSAEVAHAPSSPRTMGSSNRDGGHYTFHIT